MNEAVKACRIISKFLSYNGNEFMSYAKVKGFTFICKTTCLCAFNDKYMVLFIITEWMPSIDMQFYHRSNGTHIILNMDHLMNQIIETLPFAPEAFMERFSIDNYNMYEPMHDIVNRPKLY